MLYTKAPFLWTPEEWRMTTEELESAGIKLVEIDLNLLRNEIQTRRQSEDQIS